MQNFGYLVGLACAGAILLMVIYVMAINTEVAKPQIQACYDAGGEPEITPINEFIACRGRRVK